MDLSLGTERRLSADRMRQLYEEGYGVLRLMEITGKAYIEVQESLRRARTNLITGGPHDLEECEHRHNHGAATVRTWLLEHPLEDLEGVAS